MILLTLPIRVGDLDLNNYTHVKISDLTVRSDEIFVRVAYGYLDAQGLFVEGRRKDPGTFTIKNGSTRFYDLVTQIEANQGERVLRGIHRSIYQFLINRGFYAGVYQES